MTQTLLTKVVVGNSYGAPVIDAANGKTIASLAMIDDEVRMHFTDGTGICISDMGDQCCEHRYMTTDDVLEEYVGGNLISVSVLDAPNIPYEPDEDGDVRTDDHEVQFLRIATTKGDVTFATHNEHNGYYGGFDIKAEEIKP